MKGLLVWTRYPGVHKQRCLAGQESSLADGSGGLRGSVVSLERLDYCQLHERHRR